MVFGGVMLMMLGAFQIIEGLVALFKDGFYLVRPSGLVVNVNYNTWGWVHMVIGVVGDPDRAGAPGRNMAARVVGIGIAFLSALVNLAFISAYPIWSTIMIALDVLVIYAIIVHGARAQERHLWIALPLKRTGPAGTHGAARTPLRGLSRVRGACTRAGAAPVSRIVLAG